MGTVRLLWETGREFTGNLGIGPRFPGAEGRQAHQPKKGHGLGDDRRLIQAQERHPGRGQRNAERLGHLTRRRVGYTGEEGEHVELRHADIGPRAAVRGL